MFSRLRKRFTYANVAMTLALVFAMSGGAYAASKYVITSTKQISPKVLKALKGSSGRNGTPGAAGAGGPAGAAGAQGPQGPQGAAGAKGEEGSPWTAGGTLPSEKTETGAWAYSLTSSASLQLIPISFSIPLAKPLTEAQVHYIKVNGEEYVSKTEERKSTVCLGSPAEPKATPGNLCVYAAKLGKVFEVLQVSPPERIERPSFGEPNNSESAGSDKSGAVMVFENTESKLGHGTWAVTAK